MKRENIIKLIALIMIAFCSQHVLADTQAELVFKTNIPKASAIQKKGLSRSVVNANPNTGVLSGDLSAEYELDSNDSSEFVITSSIEVIGGTASAYDSNGNILFSNTSNLPTTSDVTQAKSHTGDNNNIIVYPVNIVTSGNLTSSFSSSYKDFGSCYIINMNEDMEGTVNHSIVGTPVAGTFSTTKDTAGTYRTLITITAVNE